MAEEEQERYQVQASRQSLRAHYVASQRGQRFRCTGGFFDSSNAVLGETFTPPPPKKGNRLLYCGAEICTA